MPEDQFFRTSGGWVCMVNGRVFGPWPMKEYAIAGMQTEQRRAARKSADQE